MSKGFLLQLRRHIIDNQRAFVKRKFHKSFQYILGPIWGKTIDEVTTASLKLDVLSTSLNKRASD